MRRRLYLHIGHPKCASSTVQDALAMNVDALRERGFLVADEAMRFPESGPQRTDPTHLVAEACARQEAGLTGVVASFHEVGRQLGDRFDKLIVSAESLCTPDAEYLASALRHVFEIRVLYYLRRQDDFLVSAWAQWGCKEGVGLTDYVERELEVPQPNYPRVLERWAPVADDLRVRPLHAVGLVGGDVVPDFFAAIEAGFDPQVPPAANTSLDLALLEVFSSSPFLFASEHDLVLVNWLRRRGPPQLAAQRATLGRSMLERIRGRFEQHNRELHARHFPDLDFDDLFGPRPPEHADDDSVERAVDRVRRVVGVQFHLLQDLRRRVGRLERDRRPG